MHCERKENLVVRSLINNSISISRYVRSQWVQDEKINEKNVVVYNCADTEKFGSPISDQERDERRRRLGVMPEEFLLLYCGRIVPVKGVLELLNVMELLHDVPVKLLLIGSVAFSSAETTAYEEEVIRRCNGNPAIIRMGYIPNGDLPGLYALADAVLRLYHDPEKRNAMRAVGRQRAKKFSKEAYYKQFEDIF